MNRPVSHQMLLRNLKLNFLTHIYTAPLLSGFQIQHMCGSAPSPIHPYTLHPFTHTPIPLNICCVVCEMLHSESTIILHCMPYKKPYLRPEMTVKLNRIAISAYVQIFDGIYESRECCIWNRGRGQLLASAITSTPYKFI